MNSWELAEAYVSGTMPESELLALQEKLDNDPVFAADFQECIQMITSLESSGQQKQFRNMLVDIHESLQEKPSWKVRTITLKKHYFRTAGIAAGIAMLTTLSTFWIVTHNQKKQSSQFTQLKRELKQDIETIKRSQNVIINNISASGLNNSPIAQANVSGTGFALSNDGYFVTNYHVTEGADSVYIQNREGQYFRASMISFDAGTDVAIFKVENKNFRFGKGEVPYTLAPLKKGLGSRVFTLGYPQDEIVYNEGYISSKNGFQGDSMQYRLELPASPGQSGAPVIDATGNVIGIVTGKESETQGTTYAVSSKAIHSLIKNLPRAEKIKLSKTNKLMRLGREQQIGQLEFYTCAVKVYKNQ